MKYVGLLLLIGTGALVATSVPDIKRYIDMRKM